MLLEFLKFYETYVRYIVPILAKFTHIIAADFTLPNLINQFLRSICEQRSNLHFIDPNEALCRDGLCRVITDEELLVFSDGAHLSLAGAAIVGSYLLEQLAVTQD